MSCKNCGCNDEILFQGCTNPIDFKCVLYDGFTISELNIGKSENLEEILIKLIKYIKNNVDNIKVKGYKNIGLGSGVFKELDRDMNITFKSIQSTDSINIKDDDNNIIINIKEDFIDNKFSNFIKSNSVGNWNK